MAKLYLLSLLVVAIAFSTAYAATAACPAQVCAEPGGFCNSRFGNETITPICPSNQYCNMSDVTNVCLNKIALGGACDPGHANPCVDSPLNSCMSVNNQPSFTCQRSAATKYPGEECSGNDICFFRSMTETTSNCTNGRCFGIPQGGSCTPAYTECVRGTYCSHDTNICTNVKSNGQSCADKDECSSALCIPTNSDGSTRVCGPLYSVLAGRYCSDTQQCAEGLWCNSTTSIGYCLAAPRSSNTQCTQNSDCTSPETCVCTYTGIYTCQAPAPSALVGTVSSEQALESCLTNAGCADGDTSCQYSRCIEQTCAYITLTLGEDWKQMVGALPCRYSSDQVTLASSCVNPRNTNPDSSDATAVVIPLVTIVSVVAVALLWD